jgi:U6 snRNA-associated Sm-like protein LSm7
MADFKKKASVLDMSKYMDQSVRIKFMGGREVVGILKGYDALLNLVLDDTKEFLKDPDDPYRLLDETRSLGLTVARGTSVMLVCPTDGFEEMAKPFLDGEGEEGEEEGGS